MHSNVSKHTVTQASLTMSIKYNSIFVDLYLSFNEISAKVKDKIALMAINRMK